MKKNVWMKITVTILTVLAITVAGIWLLGSRTTAEAEPEAGQVGRYQIAAWGAHSGARVHASGYFVLDTVTGKVVDKGHDIHGIESGGP